MGDYGIGTTWGEVKPGREQQAIDLFMDAATMNEKAVADGRIERWDAVMFEPNGSGPAGAMRAYGTDEQIEAFVRTDEFREVLMKAELMLANVGYRRFVMGESLMAQMGQFTQVLNNS